MDNNSKISSIVKSYVFLYTLEVFLIITRFNILFGVRVLGISDLYENPVLYQGKFVCLFVAGGRRGVKVWSLAATLSSKSNLKQLLCSYFMMLCHKRGGTESRVELAHLRINADFQHVQWENNCSFCSICLLCKICLVDSKDIF